MNKKEYLKLRKNPIQNFPTLVYTYRQKFGKEEKYKKKTLRETIEDWRKLLEVIPIPYIRSDITKFIKEMDRNFNLISLYTKQGEFIGYVQ